jgi:putative transposase
MNKAIKYRIYPTEEQKILFTKTFGCCRKIWNLMRADKIAYYQINKQMLQTTPAQYKEEYTYLKEVDSLALANVQIHLQTAYKNFFTNPKTGFPKYKSAKHSKKTYTTNNHKQKGTIALYDKGIKLPKVGVVKAKIHRKPDTNWVLKSATISQSSDGKYYVSVLFEYNTVIIKSTGNKSIGLDYKSDGLYADSYGNVCGSPKYYRKSQKKLAKAQRKLKHKTIGSNNYKKQQRHIAKVHAYIANQRKDFLHKKSTEIANQYDIVCVETLDMKALSNKGFGNGKATLDNGNGMFISMLDYKLTDRGKQLVKVDKWYASTQICSSCGNRHPMKLSDRIYHCECCGLTIDRDYNSAINIKNEGLRLIGIA